MRVSSALSAHVTRPETQFPQRKHNSPAEHEGFRAPRFRQRRQRRRQTPPDVETCPRRCRPGDQYGFGINKIRGQALPRARRVAHRNHRMILPGYHQHPVSQQIRYSRHHPQPAVPPLGPRLQPGLLSHRRIIRYQKNFRQLFDSGWVDISRIARHDDQFRPVTHLQILNFRDRSHDQGRNRRQSKPSAAMGEHSGGQLRLFRLRQD